MLPLDRRYLRTQLLTIGVICHDAAERLNQNEIHDDMAETELLSDDLNAVVDLIQGLNNRILGIRSRSV